MRFLVKISWRIEIQFLRSNDPHADRVIQMQVIESEKRAFEEVDLLLVQWKIFH